MLKKLLKHEFRATARIMLPLYIVLLGASLYGRISVGFLNDNARRIVQWLSGLGVFVFVVSIIGVTLMSVIMMISRFYKNLMTDEGYLTLTLPVTTHELIISKIITSIVWFIATAIADIAALMIVFADKKFVAGFARIIQELFGIVFELTALEFTNYMFYAIELVCIAVFAMTSVCLIIYAAIAIGHSASNHKVLLSFAVYFGINFALQTLGIIALATITGPAFEIYLFAGLSPLALIHAVFCVIIGAEIIMSVVFYFITNAMLKNHLNLG